MKSGLQIRADKKMFTSQTPANSENDLYTHMSAKKSMTDKRLLKGRKHFSPSTMVSDAVSKLGHVSRFRTSVSKNKQVH